MALTGMTAGTYQVIDAQSIGDKRLRLADGTDTEKWNFTFDQVEGDLVLTFKP